MFSCNNRLNVARPIVVLASYSHVAVSILEITYLRRSRCGKIARVVCTLRVHSSYLLISRPAFRKVRARSAYALLSFKSKIMLVLSVSPIILTSTGPISAKFAGFRPEYVSIPGGTLRCTATTFVGGIHSEVFIYLFSRRPRPPAGGDSRALSRPPASQLGRQTPPGRGALLPCTIISTVGGVAQW